jgi:hypothetical protein
MSRQRIGDLSKKLGLKEKPAKITAKKSETSSKKAEPNYKFQSRVKASSPDENIVDLTHQETEIPDLIPMDQSVHPSLSQEELEDFSLESEHQSRQDDETSSIHSFMKDPRRSFSEEDAPSRPKSAGPKRPPARNRDEDEESVMSFQENQNKYSEDAVRSSRDLPPVVKPSRAAPRETIDRGETVPRQSIIRLIRSSQLNSAGAELVDAVKELIVEFTKTIFESTVDQQRIISASNLHKYMATFVPNEDKDLNNDVVISPVHFERLIRPIVEENKYVVKRDTFFLLHLFVETVMIKVLQGSDMVADAAKRQRVSAKDVLVSYSIYMM